MKLCNSLSNQKLNIKYLLSPWYHSSRYWKTLCCTYQVNRAGNPHIMDRAPITWENYKERTLIAHYNALKKFCSNSWNVYYLDAAIVGIL